MLKTSAHPHTPARTWRTRSLWLALLLCVGGAATHAQPARRRPATRRPATTQPAPAAQPTPTPAAPVVAAPTPAPAAAATTAGPERAAAAASNVAPASAAPGHELEQLRAAVAAAPDDGTRARLQRQYVEQLAAGPDKQAALAELRLLLHDDRYDPAFFYNLGNLLARLGDDSAAVDAYRKAVSQRRGNYARALNNLGVILVRQGRWDEAQDAFTAALTQEHGTYAEASYNLARLYLLRGEAGLAIREWQHTLALQPDHADAAAALARAYAEDGNVRRGLAVLDAYTARSASTGAGVPLQIAAARRDLSEASAVRAPAARRDSGPLNDARTDPRTDARTGPASADVAGASGRTLRLLALEPAAYDLLQRARTQREAGRFDAAARLYRDVIKQSGGYFPPANLELAFTLINLRRVDEAIATLETLVAHDDARYPVAHYHLGRLYEQTQRYDRAAASLARAAALYGNAYPQPLVDLSRVREQAGDYAGALAAMETYVQLLTQQGTSVPWATARLAQLRAKTVPPRP